MTDTFRSEAAFRSSFPNLRKLDQGLAYERQGKRDLYPVYVLLDPNCQGSARSEHEAIFRAKRLTWQAGDWQPGETGGWAGAVDWSDMCQLSNLGGVQMVWRWLRPNETVGLNTEKVDPRVTSSTRGPGLYLVYVQPDPRCQGRSRWELDCVMGSMGLHWQFGNWQPDEHGGWAGEVDFANLRQLSNTRGVQMIWKWLEA